MEKRRFKYYIPIIMQKIGYIVFYPLQKFFVHLEIVGRENLENIKGPIILAANHTSELDTVTIHMVFPFFSRFYPIYYITNPTDKYNTYGWRSYFYGEVLFQAFGGYAVHSGFKDYGISLEDHIELLERGHTIQIYPEGKMTKDGKLNPARGGLGYMVYKTGATVVPIAINTFYNMSWREYLFRKRKVTLTILKPLTENEIATALEPMVEDYRRTGQIVLDKINQVLNK
jgi:1-acyl-sn-glycerol-3-phosphate acyltransferase